MREVKKGRCTAALVLVLLLAALQAPAQPVLLEGRGFVTVTAVPTDAVGIWSENGHTVLLTKDALWQRSAAGGWTKLVSEVDLAKIDPRAKLVQPPVNWPNSTPWVSKPERFEFAEPVLKEKALYFATMGPVPYTSKGIKFDEYEPVVWWKLPDYRGAPQKVVAVGDQRLVTSTKYSMTAKIASLGQLRVAPDDSVWVQLDGESVQNNIRFFIRMVSKLGPLQAEARVDNMLSQTFFFTPDGKILKKSFPIIAQGQLDLVDQNGSTKVLIKTGDRVVGETLSMIWDWDYSDGGLYVKYSTKTGPPYSTEHLLKLDVSTGEIRQVVEPLLGVWAIHQVRAFGPVLMLTALQSSKQDESPDLLYVKVGDNPLQLVVKNGDTLAGRKIERLSYALSNTIGCAVEFASRLNDAQLSLDSWYRVAVPCVLESKAELGRAVLRGQNLTTVGTAWAVYDGGTRLRQEDCRVEAADVVSCALSGGDHNLWVEVDGVPSNKSKVVVESVTPPTPAITSVVNEASRTVMPLAPGTLFRVSGQNLGIPSETDLTGGVTLTVCGSPATVISNSGSTDTGWSLTALAPDSLASTQQCELIASVADASSQPFMVEVEDSAFALFTFVQDAPVLDETVGPIGPPKTLPLITTGSGLKVGPADYLLTPAHAGETLSLWGTGCGVSLPSVWIGEIEVQVVAVEKTQQPGVCKVDVLIPTDTQSGEQSLKLEDPAPAYTIPIAEQ